MPEFHVPETPDGVEFEFAGFRVVPNDDVPVGMVEFHDEHGLQRRFDWRKDFERWQRERA